MLVLTRRVEEEIYIGEDVVIKVLESSRTQVKLGIQAPKTTLVLRKEVRDRNLAKAPDAVGTVGVAMQKAVRTANTVHDQFISGTPSPS